MVGIFRNARGNVQSGNFFFLFALCFVFLFFWLNLSYFRSILGPPGRHFSMSFEDSSFAVVFQVFFVVANFRKIKKCKVLKTLRLCIFLMIRNV